ncbi:MAG: nucleotidyltransferase domain-containing protein [Nanoarchaeota archaeon]
MINYGILTTIENKIIKKKLNGTSLTQNESNILSKFIRPKLREISKINANVLLNRLEYNQKAISIEQRMKKIILENVKDVRALILYGSAIQTNYKSYNDIDLLILTKGKIWNSLGEKYDLIIKLISIAKKISLNLDIQIIDIGSFYREYPHSPSLIYQLKDCKVIYGQVNIPSKMQLSKLDLRMKLDWSDMDDEDSNGNEIYQSLRNVVLVRLLLNKIVDNEFLKESMNKELGSNLLVKLKNDTASKPEKKQTLKYIKYLSEKTDKEIKEAQWEKIVL